jgi:sulfatase maturation enzyme AslB (radical SAM superfamily)
MMFPRTDNIKNDYRKLEYIRSELIDNLNDGLPCSCTNCPLLEEGKNLARSDFFEICIGSGVHGSEKCNLQCSYCNVKDVLNPKIKYKGYDVMDILDFASANIKSEYLFLYYAAGEIAVSPYRDQIIDLWKKQNWHGLVNTNGAIYVEGIADLLRIGKVSLNCSLDAGTAETYFKIKGVNCFEKTINNLIKYVATGGSIGLKYIFIKGVNDNEADIKGFFEIAAKLNAAVIFSRDCSDTSLLSEHEKLLIQLFASLAKYYKLQISNHTGNFLQNTSDIQFLDSLMPCYYKENIGRNIFKG